MRRRDLYRDEYTVEVVFAFPAPMTPESFSEWIQAQYDGDAGLAGSCHTTRIDDDGHTFHVTFERSLDQDADVIREQFAGYALSQGAGMQLASELKTCRPYHPFEIKEVTLRPRGLTTPDSETTTESLHA
jgi:hypothetical protein